MREDDAYTMEFGEIGKVTFIRKASLKNLKIIIKPLKGVMVYVPRMISAERAKRFVEDKAGWIIKGQQKLKKFEKGLTVFNENTIFQTREHTLKISRHSKPTIKTTIAGNMVHVIFPEFADIMDKRIQHAIRKAVVQTWRIEAQEYLADRTKELATICNLPYSRLTVRDNKTRWGSCSRKNNINLNIHLMRLPNHLCDYVILHELSHTIHKHHQKAFWIFLNSLTHGKAKILDKELNNYAPEIW